MLKSSSSVITLGVCRRQYTRSSQPRRSSGTTCRQPSMQTPPLSMACADAGEPARRSRGPVRVLPSVAPVVTDDSITLPFPVSLDDLARFLVVASLQRAGCLAGAARLLGRSFIWARARLVNLKRRRRSKRGQPSA